MPKTTKPTRTGRQLRRWAFTISCEKMDKETLLGHLKGCKRYVFQQERGSETDYLHWQGRLSFESAKRASEIKWIIGKGHLSIESGDGKGSAFYAMKEDTRVDGPWTDKDKKLWIPPQYRDLPLRPWQQRALDIFKEDLKNLHSRKIFVLNDPAGNSGKSFLLKYMKYYEKAVMLPNELQTAEDIMHAACAMIPDRSPSRFIVVDLPRAVHGKHWWKIATALESLKGGAAYDKRYHWHEIAFATPCIVVATNSDPPRGVFSADRWTFVDTQ